MGGMIEMYTTEDKPAQFNEWQYKADLSACGLEPFEVEFVLSKTVDGFTWKEIMNKFGYTNPSTARYAWACIKKKLKDAGFGR